MPKKNYIYLAIVIIFILSVGFFFDNRFSYIKNTKESSIAMPIRQKLKDVDLQRGVYLFSNSFVDDKYAYLAFCGGENYKQGYDVNLVELLIDKNNHISSDLVVKESGTSQINYGSSYKYPTIVCRVKTPKISEKYLMYVVNIVTDKGDKIPIINWWGNSARELSKKQFSYEFINSNKDIPSVISNKLVYYEFVDDPAIYVFSPSSSKTNDMYLVISPGKKNVDKYSVFVENIYLDPKSNEPVFNIAFRENYDKDFSHFTNSQGYPYEVLKISSSFIKNKASLGYTYLINKDTSLYDVPNIYIE